jgi:RNA polymerase sigma-70 factor (ECF subfamily)
MGSKNKYGGLDEFAVKLIKRKARRLVGSAGFVDADLADLEQEFVIDLLLRRPRFNPALAKLETFITRVVDHHVATLVQRQKARCRDYRRRAGSLDERRDDDGGTSSDVPPVLASGSYRGESLATARRDEELADLRVDLRRALDDLPRDLRALCDRLQASSVSEMSRETGVPRGTVYEGVAKLRARFERAELAKYIQGSDRNQKPAVGRHVSAKRAPTIQRKPS